MSCSFLCVNTTTLGDSLAPAGVVTGYITSGLRWQWLVLGLVHSHRYSPRNDRQSPTPTIGPYFHRAGAGTPCRYRAPPSRVCSVGGEGRRDGALGGGWDTLLRLVAVPGNAHLHAAGNPLRLTGGISNGRNICQYRALP